MPASPRCATAFTRAASIRRRRSRGPRSPWRERNNALSIKTISVVSPCYNEEGNVEELYRRTRDVIARSGCRYEHIFIDNSSKDRTFEILSRLAAADHNVKVIRNTRNFGHIRSPHHAILEARGDAVVILLSDLQRSEEHTSELQSHSFIS